MRRSRWAEPEEEEKVHDEPVTLTEKQYRALKRGAMFGMFGLVLGVAATGLSVWSLARTPESAPNPPAAHASQPAPAPNAAGTDLAQGPGAPSVAAQATPVETNAPATVTTPKPAAPAPTTAVRKTTTTRRASASPSAAASTEKPVTQPASSVLGDVAPPAPVAPDASAPKPVEDTSKTN
jgi:hypothetical protein